MRVLVGPTLLCCRNVWSGKGPTIVGTVSCTVGYAWAGFGARGDSESVARTINPVCEGGQRCRSSAAITVSYNPQSSTRVTSDLGFAGLMSRPMLTAAGTSSCNSSRGIGTRTAYRQDRGWTSAFGGNPGLKAHVCGVSFTSLEQRGIPLYRSACARKPRPPFRADKFQSLDARRLVQQTAMCPGNPLAYPQPSLESFDFR